MKRLPIIALLVAFGTLWTAPSAWAHTELTASNPADGAQVATAPSSLTLTFDEEVEPGDATVTVIGPGNVEWAAGAITAAGTTLTVPVTPAGPAGRYTIAYRIVSADGDPVGGSVTFTLTSAVTTAAPAPTTTAPPTTQAAPVASAQPEDAGDGGLPAWVWVVMGLVVAAVIVVGVAVVRSGSRPSE